MVTVPIGLFLAVVIAVLIDQFCAKKLADEMGFRWVVGCPPGNADVVKGVLGDRKEYGVRYS